MSRYFFTLRMMDESIVIESDGLEFEDLAAAQHEALEAVTTMLVESSINRQRPRIKTVEISDQTGEILSVIPFEMPSRH